MTSTLSYTVCLEDTIAALASPPGSAARGIIRISGIDAPQIALGVIGRVAKPKRRAWHTKGELRVAAWEFPVPTDLYLWPTNRSFTGQPLAELHTIGSPPILEAILADLFSRGARPAQPGEFTLRAFLAGRIDLTQAEAVLGVIDASSEGDLKTALDQMAGGLSSRILQIRGELLDLLSDLEAGLDFSDEAIEFVSQAALMGRLGLARDAIGELLARAERRMRPNTKPRVTLAGAPNAGKSTLFNALIQSERALVSPVAGTTRDYLVANLEISGMLIELVDTAGHDNSTLGLDFQAQVLGGDQIDRADLVVWCYAADQYSREPSPFTSQQNSISVVTKGDLAVESIPAGALVVSARTGMGLAELLRVISSQLTEADTGDARLIGTTAARCHDCLHQASQALDRAITIARYEADQELLAIEVRETLGELGKIAGVVYTDDILDRIFSKFCIGK